MENKPESTNIEKEYEKLRDAENQENKRIMGRDKSTEVYDIMSDAQREMRRVERAREEAEKERIDAALPKNEVGALYWPMRSLVKQLAFQLEDGEFELLVGEDASGRVPARIMGWVIDKIYELSGRTHPKMIFLASGKIRSDSEHWEKRRDAIVEHLKHTGIERQNIHKALIITDTYHTGNSSFLLKSALRKLDIRSDVASVGSTKGEWDLQLGPGSSLHVGWTKHEPPILHRKSLSGVEKKDWDLHAKRAKFGDSRDNVGQEWVNQARHDARIVADMLLEWYVSIRPEIVEKLKWKKVREAAKAKRLAEEEAKRLVEESKK